MNSNAVEIKEKNPSPLPQLRKHIFQMEPGGSEPDWYFRWGCVRIVSAGVITLY